LVLSVSNNKKKSDNLSNNPKQDVLGTDTRNSVRVQEVNTGLTGDSMSDGEYEKYDNKRRWKMS
jgi:hypothetical protein